MKIATNSIGNYNPVLAKKNELNVNSKPKVENELKVTKEEKKFFSNLYPDQKETVETYDFYSKNGDKKGVSIGSLFDKRG